MNTIDVELVGRGETVTGQVKSGTTFGEVLDALQPPYQEGEKWFLTSGGTPLQVYRENILESDADGDGATFKCQRMMTDDDWSPPEDLVDPDEDGDYDDEEDEEYGLDEEDDDEWVEPGDWPYDLEGLKPGDPVFGRKWDDDEPYLLLTITEDGSLRDFDNAAGYDHDPNDFEDLLSARLPDEYAGYSVSQGTMLARDVLGSCFTFLRDKAHEDLAIQWAEEFGADTAFVGEQAYQQAISQWMGRMFKALNAIAPEGHYFGQHIEDQTNVGFWPLPEGATGMVINSVEVVEGQPGDRLFDFLMGLLGGLAPEAETVEPDMRQLINAGIVNPFAEDYDREMAQLRADAFRQAIREDSSMQSYFRSLR